MTAAAPQPGFGSLGAALQAAGIEPPVDRLRKIMRAAVLEGVGVEPKCLAIFERILREVEPGQLVRALVGQEALRLAALRLLHEVRAEIRREQATTLKITNSGGGRAGSNGDAVQPEVAAPATLSPREEADMISPRQSGQGRRASPAATPYRPSAARRKLANGFLATIKINGTPIGECTAGAARAWARSQGINARFVTRLCNGLADTMKIGDFRTEAEATDEYAKAEAEVGS